MAEYTSFGGIILSIIIIAVLIANVVYLDSVRKELDSNATSVTGLSRTGVDAIFWIDIILIIIFIIYLLYSLWRLFSTDSRQKFKGYVKTKAGTTGEFIRQPRLQG